MTQQEETVSSCTRTGLYWILGKISSLKGWSGIGTAECGCDTWEMWFSGEHGFAGLIVGLHDL